VNWVQFVGSLAGIIGLAVIAHLLKLGEARIDDAAKARALAEDMLAGFVARAAIVGNDGNAALVAGNGAIAILKRHGSKVAARRLLPPLHLRTAVEGVAVDTGERMFGAVTLFGVIEADVRGLEASLTTV
jgi:hypothetical protein